MSMESTKFVSKYPNVVFEESEHEVVVVNLITGVYYFLTGTGAFAWIAIQSGASTEDVATQLRTVAPAETDAESDLAAFVNQLVELELLVPPTGEVAREHQAPVLSKYVVAGYLAPALESYADLQDILLLDPVHDVDADGWPSAK